MPRPLRHHPVNRRPLVVEVTSRTLQGRHLLKPSTPTNTTILGILGRALKMYPGVKLCEVAVLSNHYHMILIADDEGILARFMGYLNDLVARKVGSRLHGWREKFWGRRYRSIPILDDESMAERARYIFRQGVKEDLVDHPAKWPGISSVGARLNGEKLIGVWYDETGIYEKSRRGEKVDRKDFATVYAIELAPLPCWADLSPQEYRRQVRELVEGLVEEERARRPREGRTVLGAEAVMAQDPRRAPEKLSRSPAPVCHASRSATRKAHREALRCFREAYRDCSIRLRAYGETDVTFPTFCFPPARVFVRP